MSCYVGVCGKVTKAQTCEALVDQRAPDRAAGPSGRTNARAVEERASSIVAVGAPVIMMPAVGVVCVA